MNKRTGFGRTNLSIDADTKVSEVMRSRRLKRKALINAGPLQFDVEDGFVYRWVNDVREGRRVKSFLDRDWEIVSAQDDQRDDLKDGSQMSGAVERQVGTGVKGVLMRIQEEFYEDDQREKMSKIDQIENGMRRKKTTGRGDADENGVYGSVEIVR